MVVERQDDMEMEDLEKELIDGYNEDGETAEFCDPWLDRPEDLDRLAKSPRRQVREVVASIGRPKDLELLVSDPEASVRREIGRASCRERV